MFIFYSSCDCYKENRTRSTGGHTMIEVLAAHKREIEQELRERIQALSANDLVPENISIDMQLLGSAHKNEMPTINISIKDRDKE